MTIVLASLKINLATLRRGLLVLSSLASFFVISGCSSWLEIGEISEQSISSTNQNVEVPGIVVNRSQSYDVRLTSDPNKTAFKVQKPKGKLVGLDQDALLVIGARRMIFASSVLSIEVNSSQVPKKVGLVSKTGVLGLPSTAKSIVDAENEKKKAKAAAEEKEKKAQSESQ